jgi:Mn2+/Fe2+ NRAMP family transporter
VPRTGAPTHREAYAVPLALLASLALMGENPATIPLSALTHPPRRMSQPTSFDPYAMPPDAIQEPPKSLWQALRKIGPGIILAGSIVGSGELIQTTTLGAKHGFLFLWLILFSCVIKVFVQIELGRYAIMSGKPTLGALDELPGPRLGASWLVWWWFIMLLATLFQLGGMCGGVGQAMNLAFPNVSPWLAETVPALAENLKVHPENPWAVVTALAAIALLLSGGYKRIERFTTFLVMTVTFITVGCVLALPRTGYPVRISDVAEGFKFLLPSAGLAAAFSTFGITGVGASELYSYPYWCLEKGYARFVGRRSEDEAWARRAKGWIRVLHLDAWASMVVFTFATVAFYTMGATVLKGRGIVPDGSKMVATLAQMYEPAFGEWTLGLFVIGTWAVLFKTVYVASAGHSRLTADFFSLAGFVHYATAEERARWIRRLCVVFPTVALFLYVFLGNPVTMVMVGGIAQACTLPIISGATLVLRYRSADRRLKPSLVFDICLWCAAVSITIVALYAVFDLLRPLVSR